MSTRYLGRKKGYRDGTQRQVFDKHHTRIKETLQEAPKGLTRSELMEKTQIKSSRILRKHLVFFFKDGQVKEKDRTLFWVTYYEKIMEIQSLIETVSSSLEKIVAKFSLKNFEPEAFFSDNIFIITPIRDGDEKSYQLFVYPIEKLKANPHEMVDTYLEYIDKTHAHRGNFVIGPGPFLFSAKLQKWVPKDFYDG